jgi:hypothetical protein
MTGFYNITTAIKDQLLTDPMCNTVTIGDIFEVDLKKQTIFPLSHIIVNNATLENNIWRFNMTVLAMDIVDKSNDAITDAFLGNDNEHDVLNTQLAVLNRLLEVLRRGSLYSEYYQLDGNPSLEPFTERFENFLAGWAATFDVLIPNDMTACDGLVTRVECADATINITDDSGNVLYSLTIPSGATDTQAIADSTVTITNDVGSVLHTVSVNAEGAATQVIADSTVTIKDDSNNTLYTLSVNAEGSSNQVIADSTAVLKTTAGATISTTSINAEGSANITAPDATYLVEYANGTDIQSGSIVSGGSVVVTVPNPAGAPIGATLMKTGQTTSYRTGDDGDIEAGRATSFTVLSSNNPFSNTNRFTDELGGQTYTNNIVIDWSTYDGSTVLGYRRTLNGSNVTWNDAIDGALAVSIGTFTTGWRLPNIYELVNLDNFENSNVSLKNYAPFNISNQTVWSSTTLKASTTLAFLGQAYGTYTYSGKSGANGQWFPCRTFTVTGTTLS